VLLEKLDNWAAGRPDWGAATENVFVSAFAKLPSCLAA